MQPHFPTYNGPGRTRPVPGAEDLYPDIALLDDPASDMHGEMMLSPRCITLLVAPTVEDYRDEWETRGHEIIAAADHGRFAVPHAWQLGCIRRQKELSAHYGTTDIETVLRGLRADHGVLAQDGGA